MENTGKFFRRSEVDEVQNGLVVLNQVHSLAAKLWTEKIPMVASSQKTKLTGRQVQHRRITPVELPRRESITGFNSNTPFDTVHENKPEMSEKSVITQLFATDITRRDTGRMSIFEHDSNRKRAQIKSLPRKPPDIQNIDLFPPIGTNSTRRTFPLSNTIDPKTKSSEFNPFASTAEEAFDPGSERKKICAGVQKIQTHITSRKPLEALSQPVKILKRQPSGSGTVQSTGKSPEKGRSAELFTQLTQEQIDAVKTLSSTFSNSLDLNHCPSILAEVTFLCQLLVANNDIEVAPANTLSNSHLLATLAPRVYFVTTVFELQLPLISKLSPDIIQILIDFYPHRIPKSLRKKFELIVQKRLESESSTLNYFPNKFTSSVIFQNETDGRNNFPHQKDCQDFGKQRDLFYAIREIWASRQVLSTNSPPTTYDPAYAKVKQLLQTNSSPTNFSRLASLFLSQCLLDLNASEGNSNTYEPSSIENVQRIFESNPTKYDKLRRRLFASNSTLEGCQSISDPMSFLQYFINTSGSYEFSQHLIDHAIHEIEKVEIEASNDVSPAEALSMIRKTHLLAQILGFLWFLPYRDDCYKKPIGPMNLEVYIQSQISLRSHQSFPLNLTELLTRAVKQKRLVFTLPWIIEFLSRGDQVTFRLPAYKGILTMASTIYREVLPVSSVSSVELSPDNKLLLRFLCGKLFALPNFPDTFLFSSNLKTLTDFIPDLNTPMSPSSEAEGIPLDLTNCIGSTFLPMWFRSEMKQMIAILSTNATVKGSIPAETPGMVKHIRAVPEKQSLSEICVKNSVGGNLQQDIEVQFFQIHPSSVKKSVDFVSERVVHSFLKQFRSKLLIEFKAEFAAKGICGQAALGQCQAEVAKKVNDFAQDRCDKGVTILIGDTVSASVLTVCQNICRRNTIAKVMEWVNQHVTSQLFPEMDPISTTELKIASVTTSKQGVEITTQDQVAGSFFLVLRALHNTIQRLHNKLPVDERLIDQVLTDRRLVTEKPWVTHRTFDLAVSLVTFSPSILNKDRQQNFISFWKRIETDQYGSLLCPRNFFLFSNSPNLKATFQKLTSLVKALLNEKLLSATELQSSCMYLLQQNWPSETNACVSQFLKEVIPDMEVTKDREVIDWIAWYCAEDGDGF